MLDSIPVLAVAAALALIASAAALLLHGRNSRPSVPAAPPSADAGRQALLDELAACRREAEAVQENRAYAALFDRLALPMQQLMGLGALAGGAPAWATPDTLHAVLADTVAAEAGYALRRSGARLQAGRLTLPAPAADRPPEPDDSWTGPDILRAIRLCRGDIAAARAWELQKQMCRSLGGVLEQLETLAARPDYDPAAVRALAGQARQVFERSGLYPLFWDDPRLAGSPDQRARFSLVSDQLLEYPGIYRLEGGKPVLFGNHTGACKEGRT